MKFLQLLTLCFVFCGQAAVSNAEPASAQKDTNSIARQQIVELLPEDFRPAFTRETVIKLNAIVRRSFDAINEYDNEIKDIRNSVAEAANSGATTASKMAAKAKMSTITSLEQRSKAALTDMKAAEKELRASDEHYNAAILAGMIDFVEDVEREISAQTSKLQNQLNESQG